MLIERWIRFGVRSPLLVFVLAAVAMGAGYWSYRQLPIDAFPDVSPNLVQVFTVTEGLAPEEVEKFVTFPVEIAMQGLPGIEQVRSVSNFGLSVVNVYFEDGVDLYFARRLVGERLEEARTQIPEGFGEPKMGPISTGMGLILFYYLEDETGTRSLLELRELQDWVVKFQLQNLPGVTEVLGIGGYEKQFQVVVDPEALERHGLAVGDIVERIEANNLNIGAQFVERNAEELVVRSVGLVSSIEDIERVVVKASDGVPVYVRDVARVREGGAVRRGLQTRDGAGEVVAGMVVKLFGTNASTVIRRVEERLEEIDAMLPPGVRVVPYYEQKTLVEACVATVTNALLQGVGLVALVLFAFMGAVRPSVVVALSLPFSVLFALLGMRWLGVSANLMSFGGLAIAIGMIVDGTIVMVENADRVLREAHPAEPRARLVERACVEVGRPVAFAVLIIVIVFLPLLTLQGVEGKTFRPLAEAVALAMGGSLLFALFAAPPLAALLLRRPTRAGGAAPEGRVVCALVRAYRPLVAHFVARPWSAVAVVAALLVAGAAIYPRLGAEFTPRLEEGTIVVRLTMVPSIALEESKRLTTLVERRLMDVPEVVGVVSRVGRGEVGAHADPVNNAEMFVLLRPKEEWRVPGDQGAVEAALREKVEALPGILANFTQPIEMNVDELLEGVRAELAIKLFGEDLDVLKREADKVAAVVGRVRGAADVQADQVAGAPQLRIVVDREAIARYGINVADVQRTVHAAVGGAEAGHLFEGVRRFDILVRYPAAFRSTPEAIGRILVRGPGGIAVPLRELARLEEVAGRRQITRQDGQRFISVQCNVEGRDIVSFVEDAQAALDREVDLPPGYRTTWGGQFRLQQQANRRLAVVVPLTLLLVFVLLYASFSSVKRALLILLNIPLALVGGVAGLWIAGESLSVPASVGFIALFGIALENGMVLVTCIDQLVREGLEVREAARRAAATRLRAVLMTAATTALGLIPLLVSSGTGSEVQRPLATVVVGGLVTSTVLTLVVLPALYHWFADAGGNE